MEKHAKQLAGYSCPFGHDVETILANTYYKIQMSFELLGKIDYYLERIEDLNKKEHYARIAMNTIVNINVLDYLKKEHHTSNNELKLHFKAFSATSQMDLHSQIIYTLLLKNQKIQTYLNGVYWRNTFDRISITYSNEPSPDINLEEFDQLIWKKCLKEASENPEIIQMKESLEELHELAMDLIEEITR